MTETNIAKMHPGAQTKGFSLAPQSLDEAIRYAEVIAKSDIVPADYKGKPGNVLVAVQMGQEIGLPPLQALQNIAVINGRPCVWGDSLIALARAHPGCEYITETFDETCMTATCKAKRRGEPEEVRTFSKADAERANLWGKATWKLYPKRMLQMRARGFAIRDVFPDALRGLALAEEVRDYPEHGAQESGAWPLEAADVGAREVVVERAQRTRYPQDQFTVNLPKWRAVIEAGRKSADEIIAMVQSKGVLDEGQKAQIKGAHSEGEVGEQS